MQSMSWPKGMSVRVGGTDVVSHAGTALSLLLADRFGLTGELPKALARKDFALATTGPGPDRPWCVPGRCRPGH